MAGPGQARFYSSTFVQTSLASGISAGATTFNVLTTTGAPGVPFTVSVDQNTASEEIMLVTNISGLQYTVTRGVGGTSAMSHANGAPVVHVMYAQDLTDASIHEGSFDNVHGLAVGSLVVGTTTAQTLTNKTLTSPVINTPTISTPTINGAVTANGAVNVTGQVQATDFATIGFVGASFNARFCGATSSGAPSTGTFQIGDFVVDQTGSFWVCTSPGSPGTFIQAVNTSAAQTLTNKTLNSPVLTGTTTGAGSINISGSTQSLDFLPTGKTGATAVSTYAGATTGGPPTTGTFALGDFIIDQTGLEWVCTVAGSPGTWRTTNNLLGAGYNTNVITGGANKTATQAPFNYTTQKTATISSSPIAGAWSVTLSDVTFHGVGSYSVTAGNTDGGTAIVTVQTGSSSISAGSLTLAGQALQATGNPLTPTGNGVNLHLNINVSAW